MDSPPDSPGICRNSGIPAHSCGFPPEYLDSLDSPRILGGISGGMKSIANSDGEDDYTPKYVSLLAYLLSILQSAFSSEYASPRKVLDLDYVICHMVSRLTNLVMSQSQG